MGKSTVIATIFSFEKLIAAIVIKFCAPVCKKCSCVPVRFALPITDIGLMPDIGA